MSIFKYIILRTSVIKPWVQICCLDPGSILLHLFHKSICHWFFFWDFLCNLSFYLFLCSTWNCGAIVPLSMEPLSTTSNHVSDDPVMNDLILSNSLSKSWNLQHGHQSITGIFACWDSTWSLQQTNHYWHSSAPKKMQCFTPYCNMA